MPPNFLTENCSDHIIRLIERDVNQTILPKFNFNSVVDGRINVLIPHLPPDEADPDEIKRYDMIVFFSHWQQQMYNLFLDIPYSSGIVMRNAIEPIRVHEKPRLVTNTLYVGEMDRGLDIAIASFKKLNRRKHPDAKLIVCTTKNKYSSLPAKQVKSLVDELNSNTNIEWHKNADNDMDHRGLYHRSHIFVYPTNYPEASYTPLIRAMSAGCMCIHSSYGSLPETALDLTSMYGFDEDRLQHTLKFTGELSNALDIYKHSGLRRAMMQTLNKNKSSVDNVYDWKTRAYKWNDLLLNILTQK